ncbi:hemopexin repeat-containing protein [Streptomyces sp. NPDC057301]|uniref:hemopexin repeat-containing protein n=1 Tax=Streptomyces sp. NPDC057301 TaxID=3346093 RepID=UPI00363C16F8
MATINSAVAWPKPGMAYLFHDGKYYRYDLATGAYEQELTTSAEWPGLHSTAPDAALYYGYGKGYFFYGKKYLRFDIPTNKVDWTGTLSAWPGLWTDRVDAAVNWGNGKIYFFRGNEYSRYDISLDRVDKNYPKTIAGHWPEVWTDRVDAVLYPGGDYAYFFRDGAYRRFSLPDDTVDESGDVADLYNIAPVPAGMWKPARELTDDQARVLVGYLIEGGHLFLNTPYAGSWQTGISKPALGQNLVIKPAVISDTEFQFFQHEHPDILLDNIDQRMVVVLYRLIRWLNASEPSVDLIRHKGIGHGNGPPTDCHNQGRALDLSGVAGISAGDLYDRDVALHWGNLPVTSGAAMRLNPTADQLAHDLFRTAFRFGTFECEDNGIGVGNTWPYHDIGETGGRVIHPDYIDQPPPAKQHRPAHQDHMHMQIGVT